MVRTLSLEESRRLEIEDEVTEGSWKPQAKSSIRTRPSGARVAEVVLKLEEQERAERKRREADEEIRRKRAALMSGAAFASAPADTDFVSVALILDKIRRRQSAALLEREEEADEGENEKIAILQKRVSFEDVRNAKQDLPKTMAAAPTPFDSKGQNRFTLADLRQLQFLEQKLKKRL
ncbi:hypothetical protein HDU98_010561 [Podochytrium sp. JEL0797]|nr:hypothetical protein HDU98_010561 [Podochytrium sp. JEL0797]